MAREFWGSSELNHEDFEGAKKALSEFQEQGRIPHEKELEKPEFLKNMLDFANKCLGEELLSLGVDDYSPTKLDQVHLFQTKDFEPGKMFPEGIGYHDSFYEAIAIDYQETMAKGKSFFFNVLLHEIIHMASCKKISVREDNEQNFVLGISKTGYGINDPSDFNHEHFRAFNEAITSAVATEIWQKKWREIALAIDEPSVSAKVPCKLEASKTVAVKSFLDLVANFHNQDPEEFWQEVKRGMFTGQMMHLRKIERAFGPNSLRILAALGSATRRGTLGSQYESAVKFIFQKPDPEKRDEIVHQLLNEREWLRYKKRKENSEKIDENI